MRKVKLLLLAVLLSMGALAATNVASSASIRSNAGVAFCTNTGCDRPGQSACPYLLNANCANSPLGCQGWVTCDPGDDP